MNILTWIGLGLFITSLVLIQTGMYRDRRDSQERLNKVEEEHKRLLKKYLAPYYGGAGSEGTPVPEQKGGFILREYYK